MFKSVNVLPKPDFESAYLGKAAVTEALLAVWLTLEMVAITLLRHGHIEGLLLSQGVFQADQDCQFRK